MESVQRDVVDLQLDAAREAFIIYNSEEAGVAELVQGLNERGVTTWYSEGLVKPGDGWDRTERGALEAAEVAVVILGAAGWGTWHQEFTQRAIDYAKPLLPVVFGDALIQDEFARFESLQELQRVRVQSPQDERALDKLVEAIHRARRSGDGFHPMPEEVPSERKPSIDPEPILKRLLNGDADDRAEMLDELFQIAREYDCGPLERAIVARLPGVSARIGETDEHGPARAALGSALALAIDVTDGGGFSPLLNSLATVTSEPSAVVRFAVMSTAMRRVIEGNVLRWELFEPRDDPDLRLKILADTFAQRGRLGQDARLRSTLNGGDSAAASAVLQALRVVFLPALGPDLRERALVHPDEDVFFALMHDDLVDSLVLWLTPADIARRFVESASRVATGAGRYTTAKIARLLKRVLGDRTMPILAEVAGGTSESEVGAAAILRLLRDGSFLSVAGYHSDSSDGEVPDDLRIGLDVQTLCSVVLARDVEPPLSIGLFGDWGTGKSFFMDRMVERITAMAELAKAPGERPMFHSHVAQIRFNAWHYIDANLWASLVSHIIEELAKQVAPKDTALARKSLVTELKTATQLKEEAEGEKQNAKKARQTAEKLLGQAAKARANKQVELGELRAADLWNRIKEDPALKESLKSTEELGLPAFLGSVSELEAAVTEAHGLAGRLKALVTAISKNTNKGLLAVLVILLAAVVPTVAWLLKPWLADQPLVIALSAALAEITALAAATAKLLKKPLEQTKTALNSLTSARERALELLEQKRQTRSTYEARLEKQVNELRAREDSAAQQLSSAEARIQNVEIKLRELDEGRSLSKYLLERLQADDYRRHLGIVSTIRRDFENLAELLDKASKQTQTPAIQRIVLYVDDLDRCPAARVLEVLQAVHLLLAFKLFVVVVGVDPRWLLHALEETYPAFRAKPGRRGREWVSTPQNYLEKIFQIPFSLQPMEEKGFGRLLQTLLPVTAEADLATPIVPSQKADGDGVKGSAKPATTPKNDASGSPAKSASPGDGPASSSDGAVQGATDSKGGSPTTQGGSSPSPPPPPPEPNYDALRIRAHERAFAERLHAFVPSPRAAKRFTNVYRLLKARLGRDALGGFEGSEHLPGDFRAVMFLLAILTGFPESSPTLFARVLASSKDDSPKDLFRSGEACGILPAERDRFDVCMAPLFERGLPATLEPFLTWAPAVARFSFNAAKSARNGPARNGSPRNGSARTDPAA